MLFFFAEGQEGEKGQKGQETQKGRKQAGRIAGSFSQPLFQPCSAFCQSPRACFASPFAQPCFARSLAQSCFARSLAQSYFTRSLTQPQPSVARTIAKPREPPFSQPNFAPFKKPHQKPPLSKPF